MFLEVWDQGQKIGTLSVRKLRASLPDLWAYEMDLPGERIRDIVECHDGRLVSLLSAVMSSCVDKTEEGTSRPIEVL